MQNIAAIISITILTAISAVHIYWAFGGKWATNAVIPQTNSDKFVFQPGIVATLLVAAVFAVAMLLPLAVLGVNFLEISPKILRGGIAATAIVFGLRAMGDFHYAGLFKKIKNTSFARNDTRYYIPLCLFVSALNAVIYFYL